MVMVSGEMGCDGCVCIGGGLGVVMVMVVVV